jgi:sarcosine oxidase
VQGLAHEVLDAAEIRRRWPLFAVGDEVGGLYDPGAGMVRPERAIAAQLRLADAGGAELRFSERVIDWRPAAGGGTGGVEVETEHAVYAGGSLVIAAGAWTGAFVPDLSLPLEVERMPVLWFEPTIDPASVSTGRLPVWLIDTVENGTFYGFPYDSAVGLKVSRHHSGDVCEPDSVDRSIQPDDVERVRAFSRRTMPGADGPLRHSTVCLYTNTPDLSFVIDVHPRVPGVAYASACSGHGFKFAPIVGEILADLATTGSTAHDIAQFRASRFAALPA